LVTVTSVMVMKIVCDASHVRPLLSRQNCLTADACDHFRGDVMREMKNYLASWRLSADTGANAREKQGDRRTNP
jgi:hypothetical protein